MALQNWGFILFGVILNAIAQLCLKAATQKVGVIELTWRNLTPFWHLASNPFLWGGLVCYGISLLVWIIGLSRVPVSVAYPMLSLGYVVNALAAWWLFGELLSFSQYLGLTLILLGVFVMARPW